MPELLSRSPIWSRVGFFALGFLVASGLWQVLSFLETPMPSSADASHLTSEEFEAICESTKVGSQIIDLLISTSFSVLDNSCVDGRCTVSIEGGTGMFYDVCMVDYEESSGAVIEAAWIYGDQ